MFWYCRTYCRTYRAADSMNQLELEKLPVSVFFRIFCGWRGPNRRRGGRQGRDGRGDKGASGTGSALLAQTYRPGPGAAWRSSA